MALQTSSADRFAAFLSQCLSFEKNCSIGFISGEYFGRKKSGAPSGADSQAYGMTLARSEIVHDDDVARPQAGESHMDLKLLFLRLEHGIPSHDTFSTVFRLLKCVS